jgi:hypothetical protein
MIELSIAAAAVYERINAANSSDELNEISQAIFQCYWPRGELSDGETTFLAEAVQRRKPSRATFGAKPLAALHGRVSSHFVPRPCRRRLTDGERTERRHRKRMLGGSSAMPDTMRHHFTEGERAALCVIAFEIKRQGLCDLCIDEIGDRAGVGRTTVQNAVHHARLLRLINVTPRPQRNAKNLPNIITVISADWRAWINRGPSAARHIGSKSSKNMSTTESIDLRKKEAWQWSHADRPGDPTPGGGSNGF